jgi:hypothetical protein
MLTSLVDPLPPSLNHTLTRTKLPAWPPMCILQNRLFGDIYIVGFCQVKLDRVRHFGGTEGNNLRDIARFCYYFSGQNALKSFQFEQY